MNDKGVAVKATLSMSASGLNVCDAWCQTQPTEDLDEVAKQDILESFAMELFLTSVLPRHAIP